jgi:hypothetical protein
LHLRAAGEVQRTVEPRGAVMNEQRPQQTDHEDNAAHEPEDESLVDKTKDKLTDLVDAPEAADYDEGKTNPVTGQRRE